MNKHQFGHRSEKGTYMYSDFSPESVITGEPNIWNSKILGNSVISDRVSMIDCIIYNSIISDDVVLKDCIVINSTITGSTVITGKYEAKLVVKDSILVEGIWNRNPISYTLPTGWTITESINDRVTVSCTTNKIDKWLSGAGARYGKLVGMSQDEIDVCLFYIRQIKEIKEALNEL